jgi:antitoxin component of MazEF toxin-antitoxin module
MDTKIVRVGNSQALILPVEVMRERGWKIGDVVELQLLSSGVVAIEKDKRKRVSAIIHKLVIANKDLIRQLADL